MTIRCPPTFNTLAKVPVIRLMVLMVTGICYLQLTAHHDNPLSPNIQHPTPNTPLFKLLRIEEEPPPPVGATAVFSFLFCNRFDSWNLFSIFATENFKANEYVLS
ncbi:MAG: hypothetical protein K6A82_07305 [Prevotella sp.]|nr:hypothetical protein [Prevotella sp.]